MLVWPSCPTAHGRGGKGIAENGDDEEYPVSDVCASTVTVVPVKVSMKIRIFEKPLATVAAAASAGEPVADMAKAERL